MPLDRLDLDGGAERRLDDREVDLGEDVVALAHEAVVRADVDEDVGVARAAAERAGVALAGDADALAVVDAGRDRRPRAAAPRPSAPLRRRSRTAARCGGRCRSTPGTATGGRTRRRSRARPAGPSRRRRSAGRPTTAEPGAAPSPWQVAQTAARSSGHLDLDAVRGVGERRSRSRRRRRRRGLRRRRAGRRRCRRRRTR